MISVTIIVKNGARRLRQVLLALQPFDEILLFDTGSTDSTLKIAKTFPNVTIHEGELVGFGKAHNEAASLAKHDWIFSIDADEVPSKELVKEVLSLKLDAQCVYSCLFENYYRNRKINCCGWQKERHIRLYNRRVTSFSEDFVHEGVQTRGCRVVELRHPITHYSYESISDFLVKMEHYSNLFVHQNQGKKRSSPLIALYHGFGGFLKSYILKRGFMGGYRGFLISMTIGHTAFYKYMKLYEETCS